ncbi:MAG: NAD(P)H-dependent oxidoreductase [Myxococcota bacterium]
MSRLSAVAITGSLTSPSRSSALARTVLRALEGLHSFDSVLFEVASSARSLGQALHRGEVSADVEQALLAAEQADVLVVVTPVHRGSFSGLFKHFFDLLDAKALLEVPVILGATGGSERHTLILDHALRPLFAFFRAQTVPTCLFATERDFDADTRPSDAIIARAERAAKQATSLLRPPAFRRSDPSYEPARAESIMDLNSSLRLVSKRELSRSGELKNEQR